MVRRAAIGTTAIALSVVVIAVVVFLGFTMMSPQLVTQTGATTSTSATSGAGGVTSATSTTGASSVTNTASSTMSFAYLSAGGGCAAGGKAAPCWGGPAYVFDCLSAAQTQQGCTQLVSTTSPNWNFTINIRYPFSNQTEPLWANCLWSIQEVPGQGYGYCSQVANSTSFIIGEPAPPRE